MCYQQPSRKPLLGSKRQVNNHFCKNKAYKKNVMFYSAIFVIYCIVCVSFVMYKCIILIF